MKKIIFFDTETTGNETKDFLCQIAYKTDNETFNGLYKPPFKIPPEASAVHHISNKMVEDKPTFSESPDSKKIKNLFEDANSVVVAHNAPFDLMIIKKEDIVPANFICTLRVARQLDTEEKIDRYNLQYLRYLLDIEVEAQAHDALGDVLVLEKLFERLKKKIIDTDGVSDEEAIIKMIEISSHPSIFTKLNFGKHKGKRIEEVLQADRGWLQWLLDEKIKSEVPDEDWIYTLKHYLGK
ncbi:MAG: exonuclease domain-containing protein [Patescibacteria group bacterium]